MGINVGHGDGCALLQPGQCSGCGSDGSCLCANRQKGPQKLLFNQLLHLRVKGFEEII